MFLLYILSSSSIGLFHCNCPEMEAVSPGAENSTTAKPSCHGTAVFKHTRKRGKHSEIQQLKAIIFDGGGHKRPDLLYFSYHPPFRSLTSHTNPASVTPTFLSFILTTLTNLLNRKRPTLSSDDDGPLTARKGAGQ